MQSRLVVRVSKCQEVFQRDVGAKACGDVALSHKRKGAKSSLVYIDQYGRARQRRSSHYPWNTCGRASQAGGPLLTVQSLSNVLKSCHE